MFGLNNGLKIELNLLLLKEKDSSQEERNELLLGRTYLAHLKTKLKLDLAQQESQGKTSNVNL